ncbi:CHASE4 domain-containing protein [Engelhardtia mirabilis]|uniref:histidine kinase n=1 Tax=Engelhardtia mirabilis TaxID=2528011 RepID=A0A518BEJ6_9BACT|nr:Sensor protein ZraS [Planctomycetes bacterium Pla133]QDU99734.1 Sensor protein ZraS [Planctomycetes bacterium Pla86]
MSIKTRVSLTLFGIVLLLTYLQSTVLEHAITGSFEELELELARSDLRLPEDALEHEVRHLAATAANWARREAIASIVDANDRARSSDELTIEALRQNDLALVQVLDAQGRVVRSLRAAPVGFGDVSLEAIPESAQGRSHPLAFDPRRPRPIEGFLLSEWGPLMVSARPLPAAEPGASPRGTLVLARAIDGDVIAQMRLQTNVNFSLVGIDRASADPQLEATLALLQAGEDAVFDSLSNEELSGSTLMRDIHGQDVLLLSALIPRNVSAHGVYAFDVAFLLGFAGQLLVLLILYVVLHRGVVRPLLSFSRRVVKVREGTAQADALALDRSDELGDLSREFTSLYTRQQDFQRQAIEASRRAGMSEVATNVLHNVGNMLNSVNVSADVIRGKVARISTEDLTSLASRISALGDDLPRWIQSDPGGSQMPNFLRVLAAEMESARDSAEIECVALCEQIAEIGALIFDQQQLAEPGGFEEQVDLVERTRTALRIAIGEDGDVEVRRGHWEPLAARSDGHKLLQILVHLIRNAVESYPDTECGQRWIEITISHTPTGARIAVSDGGCGIEHERLRTIFQHGFTTKPDGLGFGLHSAANAAGELHGRLCASSPGVGLGSTFVLELPLDPGPATSLAA